jgi:superfamily II DNA or RNA helicase
MTEEITESKREAVQKSALSVAKKMTRCGLALSMGVGKTYIGLQHMDWYLREVNPDARFLVVAPKKSIFGSWFDDMFKFGMTHLKDRVTVTTYLSLTKQSRSYDVLYLDECHSLLYTHMRWLDMFSGRILGLTGTPPRIRKSEKGEMVAKFCPIAYHYITDDAISDRILNDYRIIIHVMNLGTSMNHFVKTKTGEFKTSEKANYDYWTDRIHNATNPKDDQYFRISRMRGMMAYKSKEDYVVKLMSGIEGKCIVFANTQEQADKLCPHSYHSQNPDSEENLKMLKDGTIERLSCVLQLNEGVNVPGLRNAVIMHAYGNERKSAQRIGRVLRLSPEEVATVHILMYAKTVDENWVRKALQDFDQDKIKYKYVYDH